MIVTFYRYGRLGNRLFTFSNLIAFSELHKVPVMVPSFCEYRLFFPFFRDNPACAYGFGDDSRPGMAAAHAVRIAARIGLVPTVRFWQGRYVYFDRDDAGDPRVALMLRAPRVLFEGWDFCSRQAIQSFRGRIREVFTPQGRIIELVSARMAPFRDRADILVGVHVRWGDYRGTDRFFLLSEYMKRMQEVRALLSPSKVAFLLFSPEKIPLEGLPEDSFVCSQDPIADLYSLAACDYLIGPPSTFSMWASYYGGHPLFVMQPKEQFTEVSMARIATP